jgi:molybdopterin-binding protein
LIDTELLNDAKLSNPWTLAWWETDDSECQKPSERTIDEIQLGDVLAHVTMRVGENEIESVITRRSAEEMSLKKGDVVTAVVKATEVMISKG